jgi:hypothetical protein
MKFTNISKQFMNDQAPMQILKGVIYQISAPKSAPRIVEISKKANSENEQKLIPRNQNKMVAETTTDMFMSGLMCE